MINLDDLDNTVNNLCEDMTALQADQDQIAARLDRIAAALPSCFQCFIERATARAAGTPEDQLPTLRPVAVILPVQAVISPVGELMLNGGGGACTAHVHIGEAPLPGRTPGGLLLPGAGAPA